MYTDEELLMLSGIQHIAFCERQYALAYVEMQWAENVLTTEGHHLHERVDDPFESEVLKNKTILRAVPVVSYQLGLYGIADMVEIVTSTNALHLEDAKRFDERLEYHPIEYKRGKPKPNNCDTVQLCAQSMCLEEMNNVRITKGSFYYGETRHRLEVDFTDELRNCVITLSQRMHELYSKGFTPLPVYSPPCKSCSLINFCMPRQISEANKANEYLSGIFDK